MTRGHGDTMELWPSGFDLVFVLYSAVTLGYAERMGRYMVNTRA